MSALLPAEVIARLQGCAVYERVCAEQARVRARNMAEGIGLADGIAVFLAREAEEHEQNARAVDAAISAVQAQQWQPISTIPGSHRMCLVHAPHSQRGPVDYGYRDMGTGEVMVQTMIGWEPLKNFGSEPTHWLPLPAPPETGRI